MEKVIVTGAAGQVGRQLVARATRRGLAAVGHNSAEFDITDPRSVRAGITPGSVVINCAAYTAVDRAESEEAAAFALNEAGPRLLAEVCAEVGARLIHISTDYVFAGTSDAPYEPADPPAPKTVYGRSKLAGEQAVLDALPTAQIVRTAWVYTGAGTDFVTTMIRLESERETIDVVVDQIGSPTYSGHLAEGLLDLVDRPEAPNVMHLTNGGQASWYELARAVFESVGADPDRVKPCTSEQFVRPAPRPAYSVLSDAAWVGAGLLPLPQWREGLQAALSERGEIGR
ncbi:dTDP-4-dehydrorhamnose reductase [Antrihabitans sp. YC2-6]|uniref:dTDP-4-dehydrorhamnose reductase n=1 Tax=Antrihabitans sp. YC2-6 TaxID=2799498 RepID=UPI0018F56477|nr:dTDP-4-dehydrorhamnose reductase [Antrihabitans sp. YC2-6]MBJ8347322.1 dTDP-4-dehydrorhamnose reductase [Antrihabitans sp. YC2-6]